MADARPNPLVEFLTFGFGRCDQSLLATFCFENSIFRCPGQQDSSPALGFRFLYNGRLVPSPALRTSCPWTAIVSCVPNSLIRTSSATTSCRALPLTRPACSEVACHA